MWTQADIYVWAEKTFGRITNPLYSVSRMKEELDELTAAIGLGKSKDEIRKEIADVEIVFRRLAEYYMIDIQDAVDEKMAINAKREWVLDGTGHGQHK